MNILNLPLPRRVALAAVAISALLIIGPAAAQTPADSTLKSLLSVQRASECADYEYNAKKLIPRLYREHKLDSVDAIVAFVGQKCCDASFGYLAPLRQLLEGDRQPDWCNDSLVNAILDGPMWYRRDIFIDFTGRSSFTSCEDQYRLFLDELATQLRQAVDTTSIYHAVALQLLNKRDTVLLKLGRHEYPGTCLQLQYDDKVRRILKERDDFAHNWSVGVGTWIPNGALDVVGTKLELSAQGGLRFGRFGGDLSFSMRVVNSKNHYLVKYKDSLYSTNGFLGLFIGFDPNVLVFRTRSLSLELFGGVGYEGMMLLNADDLDEETGNYINSLNLSVGFTQRIFYQGRHNWYIGIQGRFSKLNFPSDRGTDFSGNAVSLTLIWGHMGNGDRDYELRNLEYREQ